MTARYLTFALLVAAALGASTASCTRTSATARNSTDTLYIGVASARGNTAYFRGVQLAINRLNAQRPAHAHPLGMRLPADSQPSQVAVAAAFRDDPTVVGVVGHTGSAQTMDAAPVYSDLANDGQNALVAITPTATNPRVTRVSNWIFRVCPTDNDEAAALARFAIDSVRARRIAIIYRNDLFGRGFTRTITPQLQQAGIVVLERDPYLAGVTEYDAYAARIAHTGADAVVFAGGGSDAADMVRALRRFGATPAVLGSDDVAAIATDAARVTTLDAKRKPMTPAEEFRDVRFSAFYDATLATSTEEREFVQEYRRRFGQLPAHQAALAYDAATLIGLATFNAGTDRRQIRDWVASVGRTAPAHRGITGEIRFDVNGDAVGKPVLIGKILP
jgi:branched-chain amino acid transport system substrate-binding protein